jgi:hypothetical protein
MKFIEMLFKNSISTSKKTHCSSVTKTNKLTQFRGITAICSGYNHMLSTQSCNFAFLKQKAYMAAVELRTVNELYVFRVIYF